MGKFLVTRMDKMRSLIIYAPPEGRTLEPIEFDRPNVAVAIMT